jgi:hypothetical protein
LKGEAGQVERTKRYLIRICIALGAFFFAVVFTLIASLDAAAVTTADQCAIDGGTWLDVDPNIGTCSFSAGSSTAISHCGNDHSYSVTYNQDETTDELCTYVAPPAAPATGSSGGPGYGYCGNEVRGPLEHPVTLWLCKNRNGSATFPTGACYIKCTISSGLPAPARRKIKSHIYASIYVRSIAPGGEPGTDSYVVCFNLGDLNLKTPTIYRYVSGSWVAVAIGTAESKVLCASASADGAFYLGQPSTKKSE